MVMGLIRILDWIPLDKKSTMPLPDRSTSAVKKIMELELTRNTLYGERTMNVAKWHFDFYPNMGKLDKYVRYGIGALLIGSVLFLAPSTMGWDVLIPLLAIPIVASAILGWDPLYALFQKMRAPVMLHAFGT